MRIVATMVLLAFVAPACGGGGGSSLDRNKIFKDLTAEEIDTLCDEMAALYKSAFSTEDVCKLVAMVSIAMGSSEEQCNQGYQACLADPPEAENCTLTQEKVANCEATVGEYLQCTEDGPPVLKAALATLSCTSSVEDLDAMNQEVPSCTAFDAKCPEL